jgi:hypothetical protein
MDPVGREQFEKFSSAHAEVDFRDDYLEFTAFFPAESSVFCLAICRLLMTQGLESVLADGARPVFLSAKDHTLSYFRFSDES